MTAVTDIAIEDDPCRRGNGRAMLSFHCKLALPDGRYECVLQDLSMGGARISFDREMACGRRVWLRFDKYEVFGTVVWASGDQYGIEFEERLPKSAVMAIQDFSLDLDTYQSDQGKMAAEAWVIGERQAVRSPFIRLLDIVGPIGRREFPPCPECDEGHSCSTECGHKAFRRARSLRVAVYLLSASVSGAAIGIGSALLG